MNLSRAHTVTYIIPFLSFILSCTSNLPIKNEVVVAERADPEMMNPCNNTDAASAYITSYMFQELIETDFKNPPNLVPVLAESRPQIEKTPEGKMLLTFKIRPEAKWENGTQVTAKDVEFTLKTIKNPLVNNPSAKPLFRFIGDFIFYPNDIQKFTVVCNELYFQAEAIFTDIPIMPEYVYDPKGLMKNFTLKTISEKSDSLKTDNKIKEFADDFNSEKRMRNPDFISGSGAYKFIQWIRNERITLIKKSHWWGETLQGENCFFEAHPEKLIFQIIKDETAALVSLKAGNVDVMRSIKSKSFAELPKSEKFIENFNTYTPTTYSYVCIGLNTKRPLLADKLTRQALAHLVDVDDIISTVKYGHATRVIGPIHPSKKKAYNNRIQPYDYNLEKAKELLKKSGWENTNGDETLDKIINGKRTEFVIDLLIDRNDERKSIALMYKEHAKKVGIIVNILVFDYAVFLNRYNNHEYDMVIGKWVFGPGPDDLTQMFHTHTASERKFSHCDFSINYETDALIDSIRVEIDENQRNRMYLRVQEILHEEVPMIFLYAPTENIAISKKFENAYSSVIAPGYWLPGLQLKATFRK